MTFKATHTYPQIGNGVLSVGRASYPIRAINSIRMLEKGRVNLGVLALVVVAIALTPMFGAKFKDLTTGFIFLAAGAFLLWSAKRRYVLLITTPGEEIEVFKSTDLRDVEMIRSQVEGSIALEATPRCA